MKVLKFIPVFIFSAWLNVLGQQPTKHLYLANDTHTDLMWNGDEDAWYRYNLDMARFYLKLGEDTRNNSPESRSKWNYDVAWTLYMIEKHSPKAFFDRIIEQIKNDQASVPYNFILPVYGASSLESVLRSFYYSGYLERKYGINIDLAVCQENATIPLGLASLWAGSGATYSWRGVCNCATKINTIGTRDHEIYWYTGQDGSRILMKWYSNYGWNATLGGYSEMLEPTVAVLQMDTLCGSKNYPYTIAGAFGKGWDNIHNYSYDLVWGLKHRTLPGTKLFLSNQSDFFRDFESNYGDKIPEVTLAYGNEWDLNLASLSEVSAKLKRSMEKLRTAEMMAAFVSLDDMNMLNSLTSRKEDFLYGISVYNLHGWTADGPIDRHDFANYIRQQQQKVTDYVDTLFTLSVKEMSKKINPKGLDNLFFVFNSLNWERQGLVDVPLENDFNSILDIQSGVKYAGYKIEKEGSMFLRTWVGQIPSAGYKVFQLTNEPDTSNTSNFHFNGNTLETPFYSVQIARSGAISFLFDKKIKTNWVKGWLNDMGSTNHDKGDMIQVIEKSENHIILLCKSQDPLKHVSLLTFYADNPRIDFQNIIQENFDELLHCTFNFNIDDPEVWHEEVGAIIKAKLASKGGHYADKMARYDYLTLNHFLNVGNAQKSITLSNADCLFFRLGNSTPDDLDMHSSTVHVLIGGQVNKDNNLGIIKQDGDTLFYQNFSLLPVNQGFDPAASMRFALEHQNPLIAGPVYTGGDWPPSTISFMKNDNNNVILWTMKPGEEEGITLRLWNLEPVLLTTKTSFNLNILRAIHATHVETDLQEIPFTGNNINVDLNPHQLKTYRLWFK